MLEIKFDEDDGSDHAQELEVELLNWLSPLMVAVMLGLSLDLKRRFNYIPTITCVNRSDEYNKKVGGWEFSGHLTGYCLDIRTRDMAEEIIDWTVNYLNSHWSKHFLYVIYHKQHIHFGVLRAHQTGDYSQYATARKAESGEQNAT